MAVFLLVLAAFAFFGAWAVNFNAKTSIHEIYGAVLGLTSMVLLGSAAIVDAVKALQKDLRATLTALAAQKSNPHPKPRSAMSTVCTICGAEVPLERNGEIVKCPKCGDRFVGRLGTRTRP